MKKIIIAIRPQAALYKHFFHPLHQHNYQFFTWRTFHPKNDTSLVYTWLKKKYAAQLWQEKGPVKELEETYILAQTAGLSHSFIGLLNNNAICQAEFSKICTDEFSLYYQCDSGDYVLNLLINPGKTLSCRTYITLLQSCLRHLFSCADVTRVVIKLDTGYYRHRHLLKKAGFRFLTKIETQYSSGLYYYVRPCQLFTQPAIDN